MRINEYINKDSHYIMPDGDDFLNDLKKINIFVGANNSGKSRFLRKIFKADPNDFVFFEDHNKDLLEIYNELEPRFHNLFHMSDLKALIDSRGGDYASRFNGFVEKVASTKTRSRGSGNVWDIDVALGIRNLMSDRGIFKPFEQKFAPALSHVYVPILRGLRHPDSEYSQEEKPDTFSIRTIADYNLDKGGRGSNDKIFSGLSMYSELKKMLLGSKNGRLFVKKFESFISDAFFEGKEVTLVPHYDTYNIKLNINDGEEDREIFNLGDGIQSILISTFKIYEHQKESLVLFIEEPEMMMHPAMQRVLIETFISKFPNLQVFLTTHSNHFLDLTYDYPEDVAIFSFKEITREQFAIENITDNTKILDLLGVRNSSVFLSNCVIWTEGVTDRMILRKILELNPSFTHREDFHYAFAEYGGSNLKNFDFSLSDQAESMKVLSISKKNYIVIDNDNETTGERFKRRQNIKELIGQDHVFDEHVEIENLIPYKVWVVALSNFFKEHPEKDIQLKSPLPNIESKFNESLSTKKIGSLLKLMLEKKDVEDPGYFQAKDVQCLGSTKKIIAEYLIEAIDESGLVFDELPLTTKKLADSLNQFVTTVNEVGPAPTNA